MDTPEEIARDKYLMQQEEARMAMSDECKRCNQHTEQCPFYDDTQETWDYIDCYETWGGWD